MNRYKIYCTEEQTRKAFALGAPIVEAKSLIEAQTRKHLMLPNGRGGFILPYTPTAEQMIEYMLDTGKGNSVELGFLIQTYGYKQGCLTFIDNYLK